jgi:hypothetical protein
VYHVTAAPMVLSASRRPYINILKPLNLKEIISNITQMAAVLGTCHSPNISAFSIA